MSVSLSPLLLFVIAKKMGISVTFAVNFLLLLLSAFGMRETWEQRKSMNVSLSSFFLMTVITISLPDELEEMEVWAAGKNISGGLL